MKRRSPTEIGILFIAGFLIVGGAIVAVHPKESLSVHPTSSPDGMRPDEYLDYVSKGQSRTYGIIAILLGTGLTAAVFYKGKE